MFVSITRLRLRSVFFLPVFLYRTSSAARQARSAPGFRQGATLTDRGRVFWTMTLWDDERSMKTYRGSGAHGAVMPRLAKWCNEAAVTHFEQESASLPSWQEAWERLTAAPRWSRIDHPNENHNARRIAPPDRAAWRNRKIA